MKKKTIFTTLTLGLVTLLGFGFLGAINSQPKEVKASEITTQPTKRYKQLTTNSDYQDILKDKGTKTYYIVAKNYSTNGNGVWYQDTISIGNSVQVTDYLNVIADFTIINNSSSQRKRLVFETALNSGVYKLSACFFRNIDNTTGQVIIYNAWNGTFNRDNCAFTMINDISFYQSSNAESNFIYCLQLLFNVYQLQETYYEFNDINPYTYWNVDIHTPYVTFVTFDGSTLGLSHKDIVLKPFLVGGLAFDAIRLYYIGVQNGDHFYLDDSSLTYSGEANRYMTFSHATYYNRATQIELKFFQQEVSYGGYGYEGMTYLGSFNYTNLKLKTIQFFDDLTATQINALDALSNLNQNVGYYSTSDVGLGNAFALISQAFTAWIPILGISVIPGITLGMLIFLPLIAGIIIFIIWIVKR